MHQFGYLYSFSPSTFVREKIKKYVQDSLVRNKVETMNIYKQLRQGCITYFTAKTMQFIRYDAATKETNVIAEAKDMRCQTIHGNCEIKC